MDVWVKNNSKGNQLYNYCNEMLLQSTTKSIRIHALGAAIEKALCLATELERRWVFDSFCMFVGSIFFFFFGNKCPLLLLFIAWWIGFVMFYFICTFNR